MKKLIALAILVPLCSTALAAECRFAAERNASLVANNIKKLVIESGAGNLAVRGGTGNNLNARGRACASSNDLLRKTNLDSRREGDTIYLRADMPDAMDGFFSFSKYAYLDLEVDVPQSVTLSVDDSSGDINVSKVRAAVVNDGSGDQLLRDIAGDVDVTDSSGYVNIEKVGGKVTIKDSAGDVMVNDVRGDVVVTVDSSGDLQITKVQGHVLVVNDSSGEIRIQGVGRDVSIDNDSSGDIRVSDVAGKLSVGADSSGEILHQNVQGTVRVPAKN